MMYIDPPATAGGTDLLQVWLPLLSKLVRCPLDLRFLLPGHAADEFNFFDHVGCAIVAEDLVEPHCRLAIDIRMLPRVPRQVRLRLSLHESPVDHADVVYLADRHRAEKETAVASRHVLRADQRTVVTREPVDPLFKLCRRVVVVKCDHV